MTSKIFLKSSNESLSTKNLQAIGKSVGSTTAKADSASTANFQALRSAVGKSAGGPAVPTKTTASAATPPKKG